MKKVLNLALGVVTSIGGFVEAGSISTAAQAGSEFRLSLLWAVAASTLMLAVLAEMCGRVAIAGRRTLAAGVRERFGFSFQAVPLTAELAIDLLLLTAEIGGVAIAIKHVTLAFVVAAWRLHPPATQLASGLIPALPPHDPARYGFLAVSIVGATISPYLLNFYASGVIEEQLTTGDLWINKITEWFGMGFGGVVSMGVVVTAR